MARVAGEQTADPGGGIPRPLADFAGESTVPGDRAEQVPRECEAPHQVAPLGPPLRRSLRRHNDFRE